VRLALNRAVGPLTRQSGRGPPSSRVRLLYAAFLRCLASVGGAITGYGATAMFTSAIEYVLTLDQTEADSAAAS
jgi:hypothetical protein